MGRVSPCRIRLNFRKRLIRKRLNPPNVTTCVKYDLLTGFHASCSSLNKIQLHRTARIGGGDKRDLDFWFGRHPIRTAGREKDAHEQEKFIRVMLFDGG